MWCGSFFSAKPHYSEDERDSQLNKESFKPNAAIGRNQNDKRQASLRRGHYLKKCYREPTYKGGGLKMQTFLKIPRISSTETQRHRENFQKKMIKLDQQFLNLFRPCVSIAKYFLFPLKNFVPLC
jgi:hypothetical protein